MRKILKKELDEIIEKHNLWIENKEGGERANLSYRDLRKVNLRGVNLAGAYMRAAELTGADLTDAYLVCTDLMSANLLSANLQGANLCGADLSFANLRFANLNNANFSDSNLKETDLDYSAFYCCGGINVRVDDKQAAQLLYHLVKNINYSQNTSAKLKRLCKKKYIKRIIENGNR